MVVCIIATLEYKIEDHQDLSWWSIGNGYQNSSIDACTYTKRFSLMGFTKWESYSTHYISMHPFISPESAPTLLLFL